MILLQIYVQNASKGFIFMEGHVKHVLSRVVYDAIISVNVQDVLLDIL